MLQNRIKELVQNAEPDLIAFRRELHAHPELPWEEFETTKRIARELDKLGIEYRLTNPTGVIAEIKGGKPGKTVALRGDIDALPILELSDIPYKSQNEGKMHACGHDTHTAMLLTAARVLNEVKDEIPGNVRFIFQPAEEIAAGAKEMVAQGAMENVDNVFGMHIWTVMPAGRISCEAGPRMASADIVKIHFKGKGGHGSLPNQCVDAAMVASSFVMNVQAAVSRETHPLDAAVISIGKMEVGTRFNVIAENAYLEGTVRTFSLENRDRIRDAIHRFAEHTAAMYGATASIDYHYGTLPVINDEKSSALATEVVTKQFGFDTLITDRPTTGGEDFSFYTEKAPGCFVFLGTANPEADSEWAHHHGRFNVDESTLKQGAELYAQYALAYLSQNEF
ncbi:M20 family metallopeptidase [Ignatzschineria larvae DSM 13226]|uniref:M20 family metallopeptidase n=1 Tax=Ignatzschineria larvae DSM 13226 TaxID=1111732 RepID=A0ABZ3C309_9GAMM|nr:M20 family metallopeptidase [Ignatzschineria larvae]